MLLLPASKHMCSLHKELGTLGYACNWRQPCSVGHHPSDFLCACLMNPCILGIKGMQDRSLDSQKIVSPHVILGSGAASGHTYCASLPGYALGSSQAPHLVVTGAEVVWNGRCVSRALQQASHGIPACARKDYVKHDRDTLALGLSGEQSDAALPTGCHQRAQRMPLKCRAPQLPTGRYNVAKPALG